ncbi:hypothetical protein BTR14_03210 [Rhizobium rhizosphaerae]|uniref:Uncharacterized protein n=1 Tax=Xaviernesmea rhizosphaerae TaxID=1672749 RepID=A0ABX3PHH0_9HYPH|nr:hypothetical protein [Xaviernesmea rhizosphaerae]OQP87591.1 hypothetical protein BTR14_03210 [Xaviernesmea rhizosphaerae]
MNAPLNIPEAGAFSSLGAVLDRLTQEHKAIAAETSARVAESEKAMAAAGIGYGSSEWAKRRFAECGAAIRADNDARADLEQVASLISSMPADTLPDLLTKAKARLALGQIDAILQDIEALIGHRHIAG